MIELIYLKNAVQSNIFVISRYCYDTKINIKKTENLLILSLIIFLGACFCHIMEYKALSEVMLGAALLPVPAFLFIEASKQKSSFLFMIGIAIILVISYGVFSSFI